MNKEVEKINENLRTDTWTDLCQLMKDYNSDKSTIHNYTKAYQALFSDIKLSVENVLEIGIGTNNTDVLSSMGPGGTPGASLRGWRDYFPNAQIWGCDVDKRILFEEERITTFYLDQLQDDLIAFLPDETMFDVIIDDGLHDHAVNFFVLRKLFKILKPGGYYIIEDLLKGQQLTSLFSNWNPEIMPELKDYSWVYLDIPGTHKPDNVLFVIKKNDE